MTLVKSFRDFVDANDAYVKALKEENNKLYKVIEGLKKEIAALKVIVDIDREPFDNKCYE